MKDYSELIGSRYSSLIVLGKDKTKHGRVLCKCDCGNVTSVMTYDVKNGHTKSCGCMKNKPTFEDLSGRRFGRLVAIRPVGRRVGRSNMNWECACDCGNVSSVSSSDLKSLHIQSCGCLRIERTREASITHGMRHTVEYHIWCCMKARCHNKHDSGYHNYGGRGITVCGRWKDSFVNFYNDMGPKPKGMSLDRINNDGNYEPGNCRWATIREQANNTRVNRFVTVGEVTKTVAEWARLLGINYHTLYSRLYVSGWDASKVFSQEVGIG